MWLSTARSKHSHPQGLGVCYAMAKTTGSAIDTQLALNQPYGIFLCYKGKIFRIVEFRFGMIITAVFIFHFRDGINFISSIKYIFNVIDSNKYIFRHILLFNYPKFLCLCSPLHKNNCGFYSNNCMELTKFLLKIIKNWAFDKNPTDLKILNKLKSILHCVEA